jgi:hypothetical protein
MMHVIIGVAAVVFGVLNFVSIVTEIFGRRRGGRTQESSVMHRRRIFIHLTAYALIVFGFWAIIHFGPLRPVHEWIR